MTRSWWGNGLDGMDQGLTCSSLGSGERVEVDDREGDR